jgi:putative DNA primase/helicase
MRVFPPAEAQAISPTVAVQETTAASSSDRPRASVIVLSGEDDPADTQIPRLLAAGADCERVHIVSEFVLLGRNGK